MNHTMKTRKTLIELVQADPATDYVFKLDEPRKRLALGKHKAGEIVRRGLRYWRVDWAFGPVMRLTEYKSWEI